MCDADYPHGDASYHGRRRGHQREVRRWRIRGENRGHVQVWSLKQQFFGRIFWLTGRVLQVARCKSMMTIFKGYVFGPDLMLKKSWWLELGLSRNKMLDNLEVIEGFIRAWKNDNLSLNDVAGNFGINANFIQSKSDDPLFAGEPLSFQNELLNGIQFIQV